MTEVIHDFPAYRLIKPVREWYADGDQIALPYEPDPARRTPRNETLFRFFTFGSAAGFAIKHGDCPEAGIANELRRGHSVWWLNQNATVISSPPVAKATRPLLQWGDEVRFHGRTFRIEPEANGNAKLVRKEG